MDRPKTIKQMLTVEEIREIADKFVDMWNDGCRPHMYSPTRMEELVAKIREARTVERGQR